MGSGRTSTSRFKTVLQLVHLYAGLGAAPLLLLLGLTGSILTFEYPLDHVLNPRQNYVTPGPERVPLDALVKAAKELHPAARVVTLSLSPYSSAPNLAFSASLVSTGLPATTVYLDPYTGKVLGEHIGRTFTSTVHDLHTNLLTGEDAWGSVLLSTMGGLLILVSLTGMILWWPRKILRINWNASSRRITFDLHNALGFYSFLFLLIFGITGVLIRVGPAIMPSSARAIVLSDSEPKLINSCRREKTTRAGLQEIAQIASGRIPGARLTQIGLASGRGVYRIWMKYPEDHTPLGRTNLLIDPCGGAVLWQRTSRDTALPTRFFRQWNHELHTGDLFGVPGKILFCFMSFALPVLAVSGPLFWFRKQRR